MKGCNTIIVEIPTMNLKDLGASQQIQLQDGNTVCKSVKVNLDGLQIATNNLEDLRMVHLLMVC